MLGLPTAWLAGGALAIALALGGGAYLKGRSDANARCRAAELAAELATMRADLAAAQRAAAEALKAEQNLTAAAQSANRRIEAYERTLQNRDPCSLTLDDLERLRGLGGPR